VLTGSTIRAMSKEVIEVISTSETTVNFYKTTSHNTPEDVYLHTPRRGNPKSHFVNLYWEAPYVTFVYLKAFEER
jgi:hypothetical protein